MLERILDTYYTKKLIDYIKAKIENEYFLNIKVNKFKNHYELLYNYREKKKELKQDRYLMSFYYGKDFGNPLENFLNRKIIVEQIKRYLERVK